MKKLLLVLSLTLSLSACVSDKQISEHYQEQQETYMQVVKDNFNSQGYCNYETIATAFENNEDPSIDCLSKRDKDLFFDTYIK